MFGFEKQNEILHKECLLWGWGLTSVTKNEDGRGYRLPSTPVYAVGTPNPPTTYPSSETGLRREVGGTLRRTDKK